MTRFLSAGFTRVSEPSDPEGVLRFHIGASSRFFEGHFAGAPILPGVAHIALALAACVERSLQLGPLQGLRDVRFSRPLGPDDDITVELSTARDPSSVRFDLRTGGQSATSGFLIFATRRDECG